MVCPEEVYLVFIIEGAMLGQHGGQESLSPVPKLWTVPSDGSDRDSSTAGGTVAVAVVSAEDIIHRCRQWCVRRNASCNVELSSRKLLRNSQDGSDEPVVAGHGVSLVCQNCLPACLRTRRWQSSAL